MKTPPLLLGAALLFWGWQAGFPVAGAIMAVVLEASRLIKARWDFSDEDFSRIWTVCTVLFLTAVAYAFTDNGGPARFSNLFQSSSFSTLNSAGTASARTASAILRWLPMMLFLFVAAQVYSTREVIPLTTISLILRRRWKRAARLGQALPAPRGMNVSYPFFAVCLFAASIHASENNTYFLGMCLLLAWALWSRRTRRYGALIWGGTLAVVFVSGYFGQHGIGQLQSYLQNLDPQWLAHLIHGRSVDANQSRTALGRIGELKLSARIVIRLQPAAGSAPPEYLREASYRTFASPNNWRVGSSKDDFDTVPYGTNHTTWLLLPEKTNTARVRIACYLEGRTREQGDPTGYLPLPSGCGRLENLPAFVLRKNGAGTVLAEGPGLLIFDALYGPGATADAPPRVSTQQTNDDLTVPLREQAALDQVISELQLVPGNTEQTLRTINGYFQAQFTYSTFQKADDPPEPARQYGERRRGGIASTNDTPLARFLLRTRSGHCEYFATATVLLLRRLGIPARYAIGYAVHEAAGSGYVVRLRDAHSWCLVWNEDTQCWQDFDTTPAGWIAEESKTTSPFRWLGDAWSWLKFQFAKFRWGQSHIREYLLLTLTPVLLLLLGRIFFRRRRKRQAHKEKKETGPATIWPGLDSEFYLVERKLMAHGIVRRSSEPLTDWLARALKVDAALAGTVAPMRDLLRLHYRYRFDPQGLTETDREHLKQGTQSALEALDRGSAANRN